MKEARNHKIPLLYKDDTNYCCYFSTYGEQYTTNTPTLQNIQNKKGEKYILLFFITYFNN
jgi:hypothetical protein